ncbi:MAG: hypothetical protein QOF71_2136 [Candidatus Eremiobacteraeota bacterium]|jgi:hypothetical protein|nr:hypothetical protein [Candidatus Eremiobacteraeota bacterium]
MRLIRAFMIVLCLAELPSAALASLGGGAARGDNCTPFNSFRIGYALPVGTIVSQSVVVVNGLAVAGWVLVTPERRYYVPNPRFFDRALPEYWPAGPPALQALASDGPGALNDAYRRARVLRKAYSQRLDRDLPPQLPASTLVAPCFTSPLAA